MPTAEPRGVSIPPASLFAEYTFGRAFDEMFGAPGQARPHYAALYLSLIHI